MTQSGWMHQPRAYWLERLQKETFDLIVIGGGITGAGIAREASLAGLRVALLEGNDFASGTSSRSTKLIHGGLRYLGQGHVGLVREAGTERAVLRAMAPHLVKPIPFVLPIYKGMQYGLFAMSAAIWLYDRLAGVVKKERRKVMSVSKMQANYPGLSEKGLRGGVLYHEYVTDDARLTLANLQSASEWGAIVMNDCPVTDFIIKDGKVQGVVAIDKATGTNLQIKGSVVVNAAGPWIENILHMAEGAEKETSKPSISSRITHSRGIHLSFSINRLKIAHAFAIQTADGRLVFFIPKGEIAYVGTTDKRYGGDLLHPEVPVKEITYLLDIVNAYYPDLHLTQQDIIGVWSGVRPLVSVASRVVKSADTKDVSRKDEIWVSSNGLITIAGGKLTAYRRMAERILVKVQAQLQISGKENDLSQSISADLKRGRKLSPTLPLYGAKEITPSNPEAWMQKESVRLDKLYGINEEDAHNLILRYGDRTESVINIRLKEQLGMAEPLARIVQDIPLLEVEIPYLVHTEMAQHVADIIVRRTELGRFHGLTIQKLIEEVADRMQGLLNWSDVKRYKEIADCYRECNLK